MGMLARDGQAVFFCFWFALGLKLVCFRPMDKTKREGGRTLPGGVTRNMEQVA